MDYKIELFHPFRFRVKGSIKQVLPGVYSIPEDMPLAAGRLAIEQGVAKQVMHYRDLITVADSDCPELVDMIDWDKFAESISE